MTEFRLTEGEKSHPLWLRLKAELQDRLSRARMRNDDRMLTAIDTAAQRGIIACLKSIIALDADLPVVSQQDKR